MTKETDLIYEGIATAPGAPSNTGLRLKETDLIYEGIATFMSMSSRASFGLRIKETDLIYEGIATIFPPFVF